MLIFTTFAVFLRQYDCHYIQYMLFLSDWFLFSFSPMQNAEIGEIKKSKKAHNEEYTLKGMQWLWDP